MTASHGVILDASTALGFVFENEFDAEAEAVLAHIQDHGGLVPGLWFLEVANALTVAERRGRTTPAWTARATSLLAALPLEVEEGEPDIERMVSIARSHGLSTYASAYLDLAMRTGWPLATRDERLAAAARSAGAAVFPDGRAD